MRASPALADRGTSERSVTHAALSGPARRIDQARLLAQLPPPDDVSVVARAV